jgi:CubicO group peptidase (beta-lactamase class C family)
MAIKQQFTSQYHSDNASQLLETAEKRHGIFGQSLAVLKNGKLVYLGATGKTNIEFNIPTTPETIYSIYSATKLYQSDNLTTQINPISHTH